MHPFRRLSYYLQGQKRSLELGPCTIIRASNRAGKTTTLNAYRFALTGLPKRGANEYFGKDQVLFRCTLEGPDVAADFDGMVVDGKPSGTCHTFVGELETMSEAERLALFPADEGLAEYGSQRMREALLRRFGASVDLDPPAGLSEYLVDLWRDAREDACSASDAPVEQLTQLGEYLRSWSRDVSAKCKNLRDDVKWHRSCEDKPSAVGCAERCEREAIVLEAKLSGIKRLEDVVAHRIGQALAAIADRAMTAVDGWLPEGFASYLEIDGKDVVWEMIGDDKRPHGKATMSGSERGSLAFALRMAWAQASSGPRLLLLEAERDLAHFDTENLARTLHLIADEVDAGVITQCVIACPDWLKTHDVDSRWTVIDLVEQATIEEAIAL